MTDTQPPAQFDWATELSDAQGHVTLSEQEAHEIGARLRRMGAKLKVYEDLGDAGSDVQLLRMGYAAARLEIESLRKEHADELAVAYMCGASREKEIAAQPSHEHQRAIMEGERNASLDAYSRVVSITSAESRLYERAFTSGWDRRDRLASHGQAPAQAAPAAVAVPTFEDFCKRHGLDQKKMDGHGGMWARVALDECRAITTQPAPQQEAQEPCPTCAALARTVMLDQVSFARKPDCYGIRQITDDEGVEEWENIRTSPDVAREEANDMMATGRGEIYEVVPLWTTPKPSPAAQGDALDAARYRYLRDGDWRENDKLESIIRLQLNSLWDAAIDDARAAQEGKSHG